jgi:hypothetical protein
MQTIHDRASKARSQESQILASLPLAKFILRNRDSKRYKVHESGHGIYQVEIPDTGKKYIVDLRNKVCGCGNFQEYSAPCKHAIIACRIDGVDPFYYFSKYYTTKEYMACYQEPILPISIEDLSLDPNISPLLVRKRGRTKTKRVRKVQQWKKKRTRKCGTCGKEGHNSRQAVMASHLRILVESDHDNGEIVVEKVERRVERRMERRVKRMQ